MIPPVSRVLMWLAFCCLGESRREWAWAMWAEFEVAVEEGRPFPFAAGCLAAAWREMPHLAEGRLALANYALALGLLIPMAVLLFALALGFSPVLTGGEAVHSVLLAGATPNPILASSQSSAAPFLLALWLMLGLGHLRLAWVLVDRDWARVDSACAFIGATLLTLYILTGVLVLDVTLVVLLTAAMALELVALTAAGRQHARLYPDVEPELLAR